MSNPAAIHSMASWAWMDLATIRGLPVTGGRWPAAPRVTGQGGGQPGDRVEPAVVDAVLGARTEDVPGQHRPSGLVGAVERPRPQPAGRPGPRRRGGARGTAPTSRLAWMAAGHLSSLSGSRTLGWRRPRCPGPAWSSWCPNGGRPRSRSVGWRRSSVVFSPSVHRAVGRQPAHHTCGESRIPPADADRAGRRTGGSTARPAAAAAGCPVARRPAGRPPPDAHRPSSATTSSW